MPPAVLTLECAKKIREVLGETYETYWVWSIPLPKGTITKEELVLIEKMKPEVWSRNTKWGKHFTNVPAPDFGETIRLLPKLTTDKNFMYAAVERIAYTYMKAPTPEQGMIEISEYILQIF